MRHLRSVGGNLDAHAYRALAERHRPQAVQDFARAARALAEQGLRPHDIATALRLTAAAVTQLLDHHPSTED